MAILTRKRYENQGFLFHPDFTGVFSDNYFTEKAKRDGVIVETKGLVFQHQHPFFNSDTFNPDVPVDETYAKQNSQQAYAYGKHVYERLTK
jgi:hypothetical protein